MIFVTSGRVARRLIDGAVWRPGHATLLLNQVVGRSRNELAGYGDEEHLRAAAGWLERAQDVSGDGGVCGRYRLRTGWTSSYPETTGYIVPTFLALASALDMPRFRDRAGRCVDFLLHLQLADGAFPGGEVHENTTRPSVFNTAQVLAGLTAWHAVTRDPRVLDAASRAADWLVSVQDPDGAWRRHVYRGMPVTYSAHASCWLADLGRHAGRDGYLRAAERHLEWVLRHGDRETGWFDLAGFDEADHKARRAVTHTIGYTLQGVLSASEILGRRDGVEAVSRAAHAVARRLELSRWLPGVLDSRWRAQAEYACLTGNAQMALVWFHLYRLEGDARLLNAALKALDLVKAVQPMSSPNPAIRGGIPGSSPIWGRYLYMSLPNWAAKFFVDALLAKRAALRALPARPRGAWRVPADVPHLLPTPSDRRAARPLRVVLLASERSTKVSQMVGAWRAWGFVPAAVVVVPGKAGGSPVARLRRRVEADGLLATLRRRRKPERTGGPSAAPTSRGRDATLAFCRAAGIRVVRVPSLESQAGVAAVRALEPDLAIQAGAGILRPGILAVPRLGTLNAHMGLLPRYRGMNVAEWARFSGDPVGCTVHLVDPGIDTGDILCSRAVDVGGAGGVHELRDLVDRTQLELLGEVVRWICATGELPPRRPQQAAEGVQLFRMHPALLEVLAADLRRSASRDA